MVPTRSNPGPGVTEARSREVMLPTPSWGSLIAEGRTHIATAPWISMAPALLLCATVLAVNLVSDRTGRERVS